MLGVDAPLAPVAVLFGVPQRLSMRRDAMAAVALERRAVATEADPAGVSSDLNVPGMAPSI